MANQTGINKLVNILSNITTNPKTYRYISYQKDNYQNIPLWAMMKALTLGTVSKMYSFLPQKIQSKIAIEFAYVNESDLRRMLDLLSRVRNVCAHNERFFDYKYYKGAINDTYIHSYLNITKKKGQFTKGKSDLLAVLISLKYLLDEQDFQKMIDDINNCFNTLFTATNKIQCQQIFKYMGFLMNWIDIKTCPISYK